MIRKHLLQSIFIHFSPLNIQDVQAAKRKYNNFQQQLHKQQMPYFFQGIQQFLILVKHEDIFIS